MSVITTDSSAAIVAKMAASDTGVGRSLAEDVSDFIHSISPEETPLMTSLRKKGSSAVNHEWLMDSLASVDTGNAKGENAIYSTDVISARTRVSNYVQNSWRVYEVTGLMEAVSQYGIRSEMATQAVKKMKELKKDVNAILWQGTYAGGDSTPSTAAAASAYTTRGFHEMGDTYTGTASAPGMSEHHTGSQGIASVAAMTGDSAETNFNLILEEIYTSGPSANTAFMRPSVKRSVSRWTGYASKQFDQNDRKLTNVIEYYASDFGTVKFVMDRDMEAAGDGNDHMFIGDFDKAAIAYLRPFHTEKIELPKDAKAGVVKTTYALEWGHPGTFGQLVNVT